MDFIIVNAFSPGMRILSCRWGASDGTIALDLAPAEEARLILLLARQRYDIIAQ